MRFSANLGFLWADLPLPERVLAASDAGFDAVECHFPYDTPAPVVADALARTGLPMLALNTRPGDTSKGEFGLCALPGRQTEARGAIDEAIAYARVIAARAVHVMAGRDGDDACYRQALRYACAQAGAAELSVLIEPLNPFDVPGYFLKSTAQAAEIIQDLNLPNLKLMFDCYHVARSEGDVLARFRAVSPMVGHVQFAGVPDRGEPDRGRVDYGALLPEIAAAGWRQPFGAEYRPSGPTQASLGWLKTLRDAHP
tara:strand:- start:2001 stop:2765 length:765 start_codon:yes stop_codon:yes gene_type:complete